MARVGIFFANAIKLLVLNMCFNRYIASLILSPCQFSTVWQVRIRETCITYILNYSRPDDAGHVEFFREAAAYGDLYVRLGSSENIKMLKNHDTMYNDAERLFMVQNLKSVHHAAISLGSGVSSNRPHELNISK